MNCTCQPIYSRIFFYLNSGIYIELFSDSEYLADLNFIEVAEELKEGYESEVVDDEDDDGKESPFRKLIGPNEAVYVLDGKKVGNIAKFFNVSAFSSIQKQLEQSHTSHTYKQSTCCFFTFFF